MALLMMMIKKNLQASSQKIRQLLSWGAIDQSLQSTKHCFTSVKVLLFTSCPPKHNTRHDVFLGVLLAPQTLPIINHQLLSIISASISFAV